MTRARPDPLQKRPRVACGGTADGLGGVFSALALALVLPASPAPAQEGEVSREPPAIYAGHLEALLTPVEVALAGRGTDDADTDAGAALLNERITYVGPDGVRYTVRHSLYEVRNEAAVDQVARDIFSFNRTRERPHLVRARSIQPDGEILPVRPNAVFVQTPQYEAADSLYTDEAQLVVVYPSVSVGTVTEAVVLIEEHTPVIPGEYTDLLLFRSGWPRYLTRFVIDLPDAFAGRLQVHTTGAGVPPVARAAAGPGRTRLSWETRETPALPWEPRAVPRAYSGPAVWISTLEDWGAFTRWYAPLLMGRDDLGEELRAQVETWIAGVDDRREIVAILHAKAADEVRYTGLEFGLAGYQPADCNEVWANRYGDCKDKANLLRAMLKHAGIRSHLALINTRHAGQVDRRSPDFRHFNHAILAVELDAFGDPAVDDGGAPVGPVTGANYLFCDPTIPHLPAGRLGPSDTGREVLLITGDSHAFARTPDDSIGTLSYDFDLALSASLDLSGWLTLEGDGSFGAWLQDVFVGLERAEALAKVRARLEGFYPAAEVIDYQLEPFEAATARFRVRAFFVVPGNVAGDPDRTSLDFPIYDGFLGTGAAPPSAQRRTDYWQRVERMDFRARFALPPGWSPQELPSPFMADSGALALSAEWAVEPGAVTAALAYETRQGVVPAEQFPSLKNAERAAAVWAGRPLVVGRFAGVAPPPADPGLLELPGFPLMPTAQGQFELLDQRFPKGRDDYRRRKALERILQWFPDDPEARFKAEVLLVNLDWGAENDTEVVEALRPVLDRYRGQVPNTLIAWGDYLLALALRKTEGGGPWAASIFQRLARDESLSPFRRGWSYYMAALLFADELPQREPDRAVALLREAVDVDSDALANHYALLFRLLLASGLESDLIDLLAAIDADGRQEPAAVLGEVLRHFQLRRAAGRATPADVGRFVEVLGAFLDGREDLSVMAAEVAAIGGEDSLRQTCVAIARDLRAYLAAETPAWLTPHDGALGREALAARIKGYDATAVGDGFFVDCLHLLTGYEPDPATFPNHLRLLAFFLRREGRDADLLEVLLDLGQRLPAGDTNRSILQLVRAEHLRAQGDGAGAAAALFVLLDGAEVAPRFTVAAALHLGRIHEEAGRTREALEAYRRCEDPREANIDAYYCIFRAALINLNLGDTEEAFRLAGLLAELDGTNLRQVRCPSQIVELVGLARDPAAARRFWEHQERWMPAWRALEARLGLEPAAGGGGVFVPAVPNYAEWRRTLDHHVNTKDRAAAAEHFRLIVHSARWLPSDIFAVYDACSYLERLGAELTVPLYELVVAMHEDLATDNPDWQKAVQLNLVVAYIDAGRPGDALGLAGPFIQRYGLDDPDSATVARLWGLAARRTGRQLDAAAAALEALLAVDEGGSGRIYTVNSLAAIYDERGDTGLNLALLERELARPGVNPDDRVALYLQSRFQALQEEGATSERFTAGVVAWLEEVRPPWFDFAGPADLGDPRLENLDHALDNQDRLFTAPERARLNLLVARSPGAPLESKRAAFHRAVAELRGLCLFRPDRERLYAAALERPEFDDALKQGLLYVLLFDALAEGDRAAAERYGKHPLAAGLEGWRKEVLAGRRAYFEADKTSPAAIGTFVEEVLLSRPLDSYGLWELRALLRRCVLLGDLPRAERLYKKTKFMRLSPSVERSLLSVRLELLKQLNALKRTDPAYRALRAAVFAAYADIPEAPPPGWGLLCDRTRLGLLPRRQALEMLLYGLRTGDLSSRDIPGFFTELGAYLARLPGGTELLQGMARTAIELTPDDAERAALAGLLENLDWDDPEIFEAFVDALAPYRDPVSSPRTYEYLRTSEIVQGWRRGELDDMASALEGLEGPLAQHLRKSRLPEFYLQRRNRGELARIIAAAAADDLVSPWRIPVVLPALRWLGLEDEAAFVEEAAGEELHRQILATWAQPDRGIDLVFDLAEVLERQQPYPLAWVENALATVRDEHRREDIILRDAYLRRDWAKVEATAAAINAERPTYYYYYWYRGVALHELGRTGEAAPHLRTFVRYCKNRLEYPAAVSLLESYADEAAAGAGRDAGGAGP